MHQISVFKADISAYTPSVTVHSGRSNWAAGVKGPASQPVTIQPGHWVMGTAAGPLDTMHSVPCPAGGPADSSSLSPGQSWSGSNLKFTPGRAMQGTDEAGYDALSARRIQVHTMMPAAGHWHSVPFGPGCPFCFRNQRFQCPYSNLPR
jgi:hypothetical protein